MNQWTSQRLIRGIAFFADKIDGESINSGTIFVEEELDESQGRSKGFRTVDYKCPDSELPKGLMGLTFPVEADVTFELTTTKRGQTVRVVAVKPRKINPAPQPLPRAA